MYLRKKKVRNVEYLYLVKSEWDKVKKTSKQKTIKPYIKEIREIIVEHGENETVVYYITLAVSNGAWQSSIPNIQRIGTLQSLRDIVYKNANWSQLQIELIRLIN